MGKTLFSTALSHLMSFSDAVNRTNNNRNANRVLVASDLISILMNSVNWQCASQYKLDINHNISKNMFEDIVFEMISLSNDFEAYKNKYESHTRIHSDLMQEFWCNKVFVPKLIDYYKSKYGKNDNNDTNNDSVFDVSDYCKKLKDAYSKIQNVLLSLGLTDTWWDSALPNSASNAYERSQGFREFYQTFKKYIDINYQPGGRQ